MTDTPAPAPAPLWAPSEPSHAPVGRILMIVAGIFIVLAAGLVALVGAGLGPTALAGAAPLHPMCRGGEEKVSDTLTARVSDTFSSPRCARPLPHSPRTRLLFTRGPGPLALARHMGSRAFGPAASAPGEGSPSS